MAMKGVHTGNMGDMYLLASGASKPDEQSSASKRVRLNDESIVCLPQQSWEAFTEMPPNAIGYVIRILDAPTFIDYFEECISGVILCSVKDDDSGAIVHQTNIPVVKLNAKEFATGKYVPFSASPESRPKRDPESRPKRDPDIVSMMMSSEHTVLAVRTARVRESPSLVQALVEKLKFERHSRSLLFYGRRVGDYPELAGILIMLDLTMVGGTAHTLNVYARNDAQMYMLVHCLYAVMPSNTVIFTLKPSKSIANEVIQSLKNEQQLVWTYLRGSDDSYHVEGEPNKRENYFQFRETLSAIECRTDSLLIDQA